MGLLRSGVATTCLLLVAAGCTARTAPPPGPVVLSWREITLPAPSTGERVELRAAAVCSGRWYLTGAFAGASGDTRPAAWTSPDGQAWTQLPVDATSYYGVQHELYTAACRDDGLVALGAKPGGAHGNPRISSYHMARGADGADVLTEVPAGLTLYGGDDAINVARLTAGDPGYLITGNRRTGAAVWLSTDGAAPFDIVEGAPVLSTGDGPTTWANDAAYLDGAWVVVGATAASALHRDAASWRSSDGRTWSRVPAQADPSYDELTVVTPADGTLVALGVSGSTFQCWRLGSDGWTLGGRFGSQAMVTPGTVPNAVGVASAGGMLLGALVGAADGLWGSTDGGVSWGVVVPPPSATGSRYAAVVGVGDEFLYAVDDGTTAHAYVAAASRDSVAAASRDSVAADG